MKDITLSELLSIIHNNDNDKIEKIERHYHIDIRYNTGLWYGDNIVIENNLYDYNTDDNEENEKNKIFERYNYLSKNPTKKTNYERCLLLDVIVNNNWYNEYYEKYKECYQEFGL